MKKVNVGIIGLGTIGWGVYEAILENASLVEKRTGISLSIKAVCDTDTKLLRAIDPKKVPLITESYEELLNDKEVDIVVELVGGITNARKIILMAISAGKNVVTANKALLSIYWKEIFEAASKKNVKVRFEASVGGAIPIIRTMIKGFIGNKIEKIYGILNGTTNFMLSEMEENKCSYKEALIAAQKKGLAESNPDLDVSGKDSAHKLAILSMIGFGINISCDDIYVEGIERIEHIDIENAARWGYSIKLLAISKEVNGEVELRVHPTLISRKNLLSDVRGEDNAIFVKGDLAGETLLFGKGAGRKPTSSSVLGDIVDIACGMNEKKEENKVEYIFAYNSLDQKLKAMDKLVISYYLRFSAIDKPGVLAGISSILSEHNISIANVSQDERKEGEIVPVVIVTHKAKEGDMSRAIAKIDKLEFIKNKTVVIRIEQ